MLRSLPVRDLLPGATCNFCINPLLLSSCPSVVFVVVIRFHTGFFFPCALFLFRSTLLALWLPLRYSFWLSTNRYWLLLQPSVLLGCSFSLLTPPCLLHRILFFLLYSWVWSFGTLTFLFNLCLLSHLHDLLFDLVLILVLVLLISAISILSTMTIY